MKGGGGGLEALGSFPGKFVLFKAWAKVFILDSLFMLEIFKYRCSDYPTGHSCG